MLMWVLAITAHAGSVQNGGFCVITGALTDPDLFPTCLDYVADEGENNDLTVSLEDDPVTGDWQVRFNSDWNGYDASFGNHPSNTVNASGPGYVGMPFRGTLSFGPYTAIVLSQ